MEKRSKPKLTDRQKKFLKIFRDLGCNISATCLALRMARRTYYYWLENTVFADRVEDEIEGMLDYCESKLMANIREQKEQSIFFILRTRAKHRGYGERIEIEQKYTFEDWLKSHKERIAIDPLEYERYIAEN